MQDATIMKSSDDHSEDGSGASPAISSAAMTAASTAPLEEIRLTPLFGNVNHNPVLWSNFVTPEPISDELREKVRKDLRNEWYSSRLCPYFRRMMQANWVLFDHCGIILDSELGEIETQCKARLFCNKPAGFYWSRELLKAGTPSRRTSPPNAVFASIFGEWHRLYDNQRNIDFGYFIANSIRITEGGPNTIRGIIQAHVSLYAEATGILCGQIHRRGSDVNSSPPTGDFSVHPLYQALVLICDRDELSGVYNDYKRPDGYIRLRDFMHLQSLIIARTKGEHMLNQPISFESLRSPCIQKIVNFRPPKG